MADRAKNLGVALKRKRTSKSTELDEGHEAVSRWEINARLRHVEADLAVHLEAFGDELARRSEYRSRRGIDAIHFWLVEKYHWLPSTVRSMTFEDIRFLLEDEMAGWRTPRNVIEGMDSYRANPDRR